MLRVVCVQQESNILIIRTNRFRAVPRDVCDDVDAVKLYDCPAERAPIAANQNMYATTCVSNGKRKAKQKLSKKINDIQLNRLEQTPSTTNYNDITINY